MGLEAEATQQGATQVPLGTVPTVQAMETSPCTGMQASLHQHLSQSQLLSQSTELYSSICFEGHDVKVIPLFFPDCALETRSKSANNHFSQSVSPVLCLLLVSFSQHSQAEVIGQKDML